MMILGPIGFAAPWLLLALIALPILWIILRAIPPAPLRQRFPGVALLLGLQDDEAVSDRTPWWLLLLRMLAVAAIIIGLAGPVLNPDDNAEAADGPLLVVLDGSWAGASRWTQAMEAVDSELRRAGAAGREVALLHLSDPDAATFQAANAATARLAGLAPQPWQPTSLDDVSAALPDGGFETVWFSDGLEYPARGDILAALQSRGPVRVTQTGASVVALAPATYEDGTVQLLGRGSGCINSGGEKIFPEEVEAALKGHPKVFDIVVVGVPDPRYTNKVAAIVKPRENQQPTLEELSEYCATKVARYKTPRVSGLPHTGQRSPFWRESSGPRRTPHLRWPSI